MAPGVAHEVTLTLSEPAAERITFTLKVFVGGVAYDVECYNQSPCHVEIELSLTIEAFKIPKALANLAGQSASAKAAMPGPDALELYGSTSILGELSVWCLFRPLCICRLFSWAAPCRSGAAARYYE